MSRQTYSEEFKRDAVRLYEQSETASLESVAADLGISKGALAYWVRSFGTGKKSRPRKPRDAQELTDKEKLRQLERENKMLKEKVEILHKAAQYFAKEMG